MVVLAVLGGLLCLAYAAPSGRIPFEKIETIPRGWTRTREATLNERAKFTISIRQSNLKQLEQIVLDVSSPEHATYGQHLSKDELKRMVEPASQSFDAVYDWLAASNITNIHYDDSHSVTFWSTVAIANTMFDTSFAWYHNAERNEDVMRTTQYSVPGDVAKHINFVMPTVKFPGVRLMGSAIHSSQQLSGVSPLSVLDAGGNAGYDNDAAVDCDFEITPKCLLKLYNVYYTANATNGNKAAFASFLQEYARTADLKKFYNKYATWAKGATFNVTEINKGKNLQNSKLSSTEANLDSQYLGALSFPAPLTEFSTGGCGPLVPDDNEPAGSTTCYNEPYLEFLNAVLALDDDLLPQVISISYGEDEQTWPPAQAAQVCTLFMQLGARGVSILVASGDNGPGASCISNNGTSAKTFIPNFPASCPYVTTVGATMNINPEQATTFTGGGFSNYFPRPAWQTAAVAGYVSALNGKFARYYNSSGRAYPDVSAQGASFDVIDQSYLSSVYGTSASTPVFAALISLLNSARIDAGQATLGFLNPLLYGAANGTFTDITEGSSSGCDGEINGAGFEAVKGWDAATGLGTPDFGKMLGVIVPGACNTGGVLGKNPTSTVCGVAGATAAVGV